MRQTILHKHTNSKYELALDIRLSGHNTWPDWMISKMFSKGLCLQHHLSCRSHMKAKLYHLSSICHIFSLNKIFWTENCHLCWSLFSILDPPHPSIFCFLHFSQGAASRLNSPFQSGCCQSIEQPISVRVLPVDWTAHFSHGAASQWNSPFQ